MLIPYSSVKVLRLTISAPEGVSCLVERLLLENNLFKFTQCSTPLSQHDMPISRRELIKKTFLGLSIIPFLPSKYLLAESGDCVTTNDIEGPFYLEGMPFINTIAPTGLGLPAFFVTGTVYAKDCLTPLSNALVDVWHANDAGGYEDINYRGRIYTDVAGNYAFETIYPGKYLNGASYRPSHIHYKVSYLLSPALTTQLYFKGDTSIPDDPWASDSTAADRIVPVTEDLEGNQHAVFDVFLEVDAPVSVVDLERKDQKSHIRSLHPNPIASQSIVTFYLKENSQASLMVYDVQGQIVSSVFEQECPRGVTTFALSKNKLSAGVYMLQLMVNGEGVDVKRLLIQ